jgi:hypothetical protein
MTVLRLPAQFGSMQGTVRCEPRITAQFVRPSLHFFAMPRATTPKVVETEVLVSSRRRCALCFGLHADSAPKTGQIAHVDRDASNSSLLNLAWLCLAHHDEYDTRRSQSKGFTPEELRGYRDELHVFIVAQRMAIEPHRPAITVSPEGVSLAALLNARSQSGYKFDPQVRIDTLAELLELSVDDVEIAIDELARLDLLEVNGSRDVVFATNRLFWDTDPIFTAFDPAADAETVARVLTALSSASITMADLASQLAWSPRRLNPAASYLVESENAHGRQALGSAPFWYLQLRCTVSTKRVVRDMDRRTTSGT